MKKVLLFLIICINVFAFKMENVTYNKSLNNGYREYKIYNEGTNKMRYKVDVLPSEINEDITDCLKIFPKVITIEPKSYQVVRVLGTSERKLENKEYFFYLYFNPISIPTFNTKEGEISGSGVASIAPKVQMKGYGGIIDYSKELNFENMRFYTENNTLYVNGDVVNNSHGTVELGLNFNNLNKEIGNSKGIGEVPAKSKINVTVPLPNFKEMEDIRFITFYNDAFEELKIVKIKDGKIEN